jgi:hypothetical protein
MVSISSTFLGVESTNRTGTEAAIMFEKHKVKKLAASGGVHCRDTVLTPEQGDMVSGRAIRP